MIQTYFFEKIRKKVHIIGKLSHNEEEDVKLRLVWDEYKDDYCQCCQLYLFQMPKKSRNSQLFLKMIFWNVELATLIIAKIAEKDAHIDDDGRTIASEWWKTWNGNGFEVPFLHLRPNLKKKYAYFYFRSSTLHVPNFFRIFLHFDEFFSDTFYFWQISHVRNGKGWKFQ